MRNCKEISNLVSESMERKLKLTERIELRMHLMMCRLCRLFRANVIAIQTVTKLLGREFTNSQAFLSHSAKERITAALREAQSNNDN